MLPSQRHSSCTRKKLSIKSNEENTIWIINQTQDMNYTSPPEIWWIVSTIIISPVSQTKIDRHVALLDPQKMDLFVPQFQVLKRRQHVEVLFQPAWQAFLKCETIEQEMLIWEEYRFLILTWWVNVYLQWQGWKKARNIYSDLQRYGNY